MEERFGALLRPIRDAALAFEVDVSAELEEYIEQCVRSLGMDESHLVNFAEAGLLLQGSALILGRKVEHLHALVYKTLENLKTRPSRRSSVPDDQPAAPEPAQAPLLEPLDDDDRALRPGKNIDLPTTTSKRPQKIRRAHLFEADDTECFSSCVWLDSGNLVLKDLLDHRHDDDVAMDDVQEDPVPADDPPPVADDDEPMPTVDDDYEPVVDDYEPAMAHDDDVAHDESPPVVHDDVVEESPYDEIDPLEESRDDKPLRSKGKYWKLPVVATPRQRTSRNEASLGAQAAVACAAVGRATPKKRPALVAQAVEACERKRRATGPLVWNDESPEDSPPVDDSPPVQGDDNYDEPPVVDDYDPPVVDDDYPPPMADDDYPAVDEEPPLDFDPRRISTASSILSHCNVSALAKRVAAWQDHIEPLLKSRDARPPFDAKRAGVDLADDMKKTREKHVPFAALTGKLPRYQVCRRFLAALQLANEGKVGLEHATAADYMPDPNDFRLTLLVDDVARLDDIAEEENDTVVT